MTFFWIMGFLFSVQRPRLPALGQLALRFEQTTERGAHVCVGIGDRPLAFFNIFPLVISNVVVHCHRFSGKYCPLKPRPSCGVKPLISCCVDQNQNEEAKQGNNNNTILRFTRCPHLNTNLRMLRTELYTLNCV